MFKIPKNTIVLETSNFEYSKFKHNIFSAFLSVTRFWNALKLIGYIRITSNFTFYSSLQNSTEIFVSKSSLIFQNRLNFSNCLKGLRFLKMNLEVLQVLHYLILYYFELCWEFHIFLENFLTFSVINFLLKKYLSFLNFQNVRDEICRRSNFEIIRFSANESESNFYHLHIRIS